MLRSGVICNSLTSPLHLMLASWLPKTKQAADFCVSLRVVIKVAQKRQKFKKHDAFPGTDVLCMIQASAICFCCHKLWRRACLGSIYPALTCQSSGVGVILFLIRSETTWWGLKSTMLSLAHLISCNGLFATAREQECLYRAHSALLSHRTRFDMPSLITSHGTF